MICESVPKPLPLSVLCQAAAHAVRVGPRQCRVVPDRLAEPEKGRIGVFECKNRVCYDDVHYKIIVASHVQR